jgi:NAD(P)-dependent dehydrogenase (short-subunit alcohol dehydrogenase family)
VTGAQRMKKFTGWWHPVGRTIILMKQQFGHLAKDHHVTSRAAQQRFCLDNQVALVTGAARGIGQGIAIALAEHGADVAVLDRAPEAQAASTLQAIRERGRSAWYFQQDLAETDKLPSVARQIWQTTTRVDILVNNAGIGYQEHFNQITLARWRQVLAVNTDAVFFLSQAIAERMITARIAGRIVNTSSVNGLVAEAGLAHYNASKGAIEMITKSLAIELGQHGITVNSLCPGMIDTQIDDDFALADGFVDYFNQHIPLGHRFGTVDECAGAVIFFASPAGRYVTGQHLIVDGGLLCEQVPRLRYMPPYQTSMDP